MVAPTILVVGARYDVFLMPGPIQPTRSFIQPGRRGQCHPPYGMLIFGPVGEAYFFKKDY